MKSTIVILSGLILGLCPANERSGYKVTPSLIGGRKPRILLVLWQEIAVCFLEVTQQSLVVYVWFHSWLFHYTPRNEVRGGVYWIHLVCLSVCLSVCPSVCPLTFRVRPVASTVQDGFFQYLVQMINSMRGCVTCDDPWPWPISSRSFGLDLENCVRSVAFTVLDGFFLYLAQMITIIRGCAASNVFFRIWKFEFFAIFFLNLALTLKIFFTVLNGFFPYLAQMITSMRGCVAYNELWPWPISSRSFGLGLENRVRSVASTVLYGFFPYLVQMITSMRRCVACDDLWPWPISSRSFGLDLENRVRSVVFTVLDGFFLYLAQMITIIRGCVASNVFFRIWKFEFFAIFFLNLALTLKKNLQFSMDSFHI